MEEFKSNDDYEPKEMSNYYMEYSPNSNDVCTNCKRQIKIGPFRYGKAIDTNQLPIEWIHFNCIREEQIIQIFRDLPDQDIHTFRGFSSLTIDQRDEVITLMENVSDKHMLPKLITRKLPKEEYQKIIDRSKYRKKRDYTNKSKTNYHQKKLKRQKVIDQRIHECDVCGKCFNQKSDMTKHMRIHTGEKPFECDLCGKCFTQKHHLTKHIRIHTGEKLFECDVCETFFTQKNNLTIHKRNHTGEKPFECVCGKCFNNKSNLTRHMRIHTGKEPFECDVCGKCFAYKNSLNNHSKYHY